MKTTVLLGRTSWAVRPIGFACLLLFAGACGSSRSDSAASPSNTSAENSVANPAADTTPPTTIPEPKFVAHMTTTWFVTNSAGDKSRAELTVGDLALPQYSMPTPSGQRFTPADCTTNSERDLVAPFSLQVFNANTGFAQRVTAKLVGEKSYQGQDAKLAALVYYSDGPSCRSIYLDAMSGSQTLGCQANEPIADGESITCEGFFLLKGVVGPGQENGDTEAIAKISPSIYSDIETKAYDVTGVIDANSSFPKLDFASLPRQLSDRSTETPPTTSRAQVQQPTLRFTTKEGWSYTFTPPTVNGASLSVDKYVDESPPGKARLRYRFDYGNIQATYSATGDTAGRRAPDLSMRTLIVLALPDASLPQDWKEEYSYFSTGGGCSITGARYGNEGTEGYSGPNCTNGNNSSKIQDTRDYDEPLVNDVIATTTQASLVVLFRGPCTLVLTPNGWRTIDDTPNRDLQSCTVN